MTLKRAFAPVVDPRTRLLILGSLPGDASLAAGQYYAHPRNAFWTLIGGVIGCDLAALRYDARLEALKAAGVGLSDVLTSADRQGSLDAAIRRAQAADLRGLIATLPALRVVAFNGLKAATIGRRILAGASVDMIDLPSSSPAHTQTAAKKAAAWSVLKEAVAG